MSELARDFALAADFPASSREDWRKRVDAALKGTPFERLLSRTYDELCITPLPPRRSEARPIAMRTGGAPWQVMARIDRPDPALANEAAREELQNGATGLSLVFAGAIGDYGFGLPPTEEALGRALEGIDTAGKIAIELDLSPPAEAAIDAALAKGLTLPRGGKALRIGHDPLGTMASAGGATRRWSEEAPHFARRLAALARDGWQKLAAADGRVVHNAGGSEAQELAFALAVALAYLRAMEDAGLPLEHASRMIFFRLAADADQLLTIAKFRAMRKLWGRIEASCGLAAERAFISAETAWRTMTRRDPHTNILRTTIAVFSAAIGGADAISALPFTAALGLPDAFARRLARNAQLILLEETHLDRVIDPAAGSGAVEDLTDQLCRVAWTLFQEIEAAGGAAAGLERGLIQGKVAAVRAQREAAVARLQDALTGVSIFPALDEGQVAVLEKAPMRSNLAALPAQTAFAPLPPIRLAEPFEALRDMSDRRLAETGARPKVFLANLGRRGDDRTRASFAKNFFEAGGIEALSGEGATPTLAGAFTASGALLACLCGTDQAYSGEAAPAAAAFSAAGARHIYLVGQPGTHAQDYAGVQTFIHEGCDALAILGAAYRLIAS
jgi:methylmalonyl-CoA mutase